MMRRDVFTTIGAKSYVLCLLFTFQILRCVASPWPEDELRESNKLSSYDSLLKRLELKNNMLKSSLLTETDSRATKNEVDDFDYYMMDQKEVKRAWSRDKMKKHEDFMNTHFVKKAMENVNMVLKTAQCQYPTRRCLDVNKMEFGKTKHYWPNCAIVYKCGHDSGCCTDPDHVCSPVQTEPIELFFFSLENNSEQQTGKVELLTFENHTLCDCRLPPKGSEIPEQLRDCNCPKHFMPVPSSLECRCDCDEKLSKPCKKVKKGRRSYHLDKGCHGKCGPPACDFGEFKKDFGRCPRKSEKTKRRK